MVTTWDRVCRAYYGLHARIHAFWHIIRGHRVEWYSETMPWIGYFGSISCIDCPDCDGQSLGIWSRNSDFFRWIGQHLCSLLGHSTSTHLSKWDADGKMINEDDLSDIRCSRCLTPLPQEE